MADEVRLVYRGVKVTVSKETAGLLSSDFKPAEVPASKPASKPRTKKPE